MANRASEMEQCNVIVIWNAEVTVKVALLIYNG